MLFGAVRVPGRKRATTLAFLRPACWLFLFLSACGSGKRDPIAFAGGADGTNPKQPTSARDTAPDAAMAMAMGNPPTEKPDAAVDMGPAALPNWEGMPGLCRRPGDDPVRDLFCDENVPIVKNFTELRVGVQGDVHPTQAVTTPVVALGLSTALSGRLVSPINPRLLLLGEVFVAFQRGVQRVEMAVRDRKTGRLSFYLLEFEQDCNTRERGCLPGDLYTPAIEENWSNVTLQDDEDLKNTPADCRQCHQRGATEPVLLMRELRAPWTHFFAPEVQVDFPLSQAAEGGAMALDYRRAKDDEPLGGVPADRLTKQSLGAFLENFAASEQPLVFDSAQIFNERFPPGTDLGPLRSPTWDQAFEAFQRGEQLALPHYDGRPIDSDKLAHLTEAYVAYRSGELAMDELPDLADIYPDDPMIRAELGLETVPGATPAQVLIQACGTCHNGVLDQTISRARFNIDLSRMSREELDLAAQRLNTPQGDKGSMPPPEARQLRAPVRAALLQYLQLEQWPDADLALLQGAARHGMAGGRQKASATAYTENTSD